MSLPQLTTLQVAQFVGGRLIGSDKPIEGVCTLIKPRPNALAFAKSWDKVVEAGVDLVRECVLILPPEAEGTSFNLDAAILAVNPRLAFAQILAEYFQPRPSMSIAKTAQIGRNVKIGANVTIGEYCVVGDDVMIGDHTELRHHVVIGRNVKIGKSCLVRSHSVVGEEGFGMEKDEKGRNFRIPHIGGVIIGNNVEIGALTTVCSGTIEPTSIADFVKIDDHVHIAHNCRIGTNTVVIACAEISGSVSIGKDAWFAPNCSVLNGVSIDDNAIIGIGAVVIKDCDAGGVYVGSPARLLRRNKGG